VLDALVVGMTGKMVHYILNSDIQRFFDVFGAWQTVHSRAIHYKARNGNPGLHQAVEAVS